MRELANAPERIRAHAYVSLRAAGQYEEAAALRAEVEAEEKRLRELRLKRCTG